MRRRLLALGAPAEHVAELNQCIRDLHRAGFAIHASFAKRILDSRWATGANGW
jgi:hypothetical protein